MWSFAWRCGIDNLVSAQRLTPGVVFTRGPDEGVQLTFRGLGTPARNTSFEQSVGAFTDGVFYGHPAMYVIPFFDVERLEFIKGTQSALLGKNTSVVAQETFLVSKLRSTVNLRMVAGLWTPPSIFQLPRTLS